jgi:Predicted ester cyclase
MKQTKGWCLMSAHKNIELVKRFYQEVYTNLNPEAFDQFCSTDVLVKDPVFSNEEAGIENLKQLEIEYNRAFPDKTTLIDNLIGNDNYVTVCWTSTGHQQGNLMGIPPSNKEISISGISCYKIEHEKITEINQCWDTLGLLQQIGGLETAQSNS